MLRILSLSGEQTLDSSLQNGVSIHFKAWVLLWLDIYICPSVLVFKNRTPEDESGTFVLHHSLML